MVQCDRCPPWYHYTCAHVDNNICDKSWVCSKCEGKNASLSSSLVEVSAAAAVSVPIHTIGNILNLGAIPKSSTISRIFNNPNYANLQMQTIMQTNYSQLQLPLYLKVISGT